MPLYRVEWSIDLEAETPREAAEMAFQIMQKPGTTATVFDVAEFDSDGEAVRVDLMVEEGEQ